MSQTIAFYERLLACETDSAEIELLTELLLEANRIEKE